MIRNVYIFLYLFAFQTLANQLIDEQSLSKQVLVLIHSRTGNTLSFAKTLQSYLQKIENINVTIKRVPPLKLLAPDLEEMNELPIATIDELANYDALIFGSPVYFYAPSAEIMAFLQEGMRLWQEKSLKDKPAAVFLSSNKNGLSFAENSLRASIRALHMDDSIATRCSETLSNAEQFAACFATNLMAKNQVPIELPAVPQPVGLYQPYKISGNQIYINQIALKNGVIEYPGIIGDTLTEEQAKISTRDAMLNVLAVLNQAVGGDLSKVKQAVQLSGFFTTVVGYTTHSRLLDEASKVTIEFLGEEKGKHTRGSFGVPSLPANSPVEIQAIFELKVEAPKR